MIDTAKSASLPARGTLFVHACTKAMSTPLEWVLAEVLGESPLLSWRTQPISPSMLRTDLDWSGAAGTAARLASSLRSIPHLRFEVTEHQLGGAGHRYSFTPALGVFRADIDVHGNLQVGEQQLRSLLERLARGEGDAAAELDRWLGTEWDAELEPFRVAADGDSVRWLHQVG